MNRFAGVFLHAASASNGLNIPLIKHSMGSAAANRTPSQYRDQHCYLEVMPQQLLQAPGLMLIYAGAPYWSDHGEQLPLTDQRAANLLADSLRREGGAALGRLKGHFACALIDAEAGECHLLTDRVGVYRLYWTQTAAGALVFGTSLAQVRGLANERNAIAADAIYAYLYFHMVPTPYSIYAGIQKLPPAELLTASGGRTRTTPLHLPTFNEAPRADAAALERELVETLSRSVHRSMQAQPRCGAFLSGGLDSSTVAGFMARHSETPPKTYSIGFDAKEYDETPFARISAKHFGTDSHEYFVTPRDVVEIVPRIARFYEEPFGNSSVVPSYYCARVARDDGVALMLAGDGGDELFAGNERYAKQRQFRFYNNLPPALRRWLLDLPVQALPASIGLVRKARSYIEQARTPLPDRLQNYNFLTRHAADEVFSPDFVARLDREMPLRLQREVYNAPAQGSELSRMLYWDWRFTLADNDLRKVSAMCEMAGMEVAYPLLSDELIDFSCRVPASLKLKQGQLRYFYKQALRDFLHPQTLAKSKHGFGLPFGLWLRDFEPLKQLARDSLEQLKGRGYFNPAFLDQTFTLHQEQHAAYYGELVWLLMMLELWLQAHADVDL